ncbi:MAG: hypothetical protein Q7S32_04330 [bacterium]|nr:hypothetical protein [bacterium]
MAKTRGQEVPAEAKVEAILQLFYNNMHSIEKHAEAKAAAYALIEKCPNNPLLFELWAAIEWSAISLELEGKFDERRFILDIAPYRKRAEYYHSMVQRGLETADQALLIGNGEMASRRKWLFAKGALYFADSKFTVKFEDGKGFDGMRRADQSAANGIREFKKSMAEDSTFFAPYLYLGGARYQMSIQSWVNRTAVRFASHAFAEINSLCEGDVINKPASIQWLERSYAYGAPEPWLKKNWIESALVLEGMYEKFRVEAGFKLSDEVVFIENKELPVVLRLLEQFPENKRLNARKEALDLRLSILNNYLNKK